MKKVLKLKNIGKLSYAEIDLEGITVICGENNSGKSTVGKALYNVYYSFENSEEIADTQRKNKLGKQFDDLHKDLMFQLKNLNSTATFFSKNDFSNIKGNYKAKIKKCDASNIEKTVDGYIEKCVEMCKNKYSKDADYSVLIGFSAIWKKSFMELCLISNKDIVKNNISVKTEKIFHGQATTIPCDNASIELNDDNKSGKLSILYSGKDKCTNYSQDFIVNNDDLPIYIENPQVIDLFSTPSSQIKNFVKTIFSPQFNYEGINLQLALGNFVVALNKYASNYNKEDSSQMDIIQTEKKISDMIEELNKILNGKFELSSSTIRFKENEMPISLDIRNLSTGVKSMAVIERCLSSGVIKEGSTLILDEPEIHLHPEWQLKYAEFIIILQKALNLTVLITTHSPQFLRAVECYMDKYEVMDRLNVYSINNGKVINASYSEYGISEIYEKLSRPYDVLQQMIDEKYGEDDD